jgi:D-3-phosphoglycerate dehydrogenase
MRRNYYGEKALGGLAELGDLTLHEDDAPLDASALVERAAGHHVIVSDRQTPGAAQIFAALPELVAFVRCAVDIRNIAVPAASEAGVLVTHASPGFVASVAEMAIGFMISLGRSIPDYVASYQAGAAPPARIGRQLRGSTVGIIGYGAIGRYLAELGLACGMRVLVNDPYARVERDGLEQVELTALLAASDFVVCLVVANEQTENLVNAATFACMKPTAFFINLSRGNLVDEKALEAALATKRIAGAALDVGRAADQMPSLFLAQRADVIATPHVAGLTPPAIEHQALETVRQVAEIVVGRAPPGAVNETQATRLARMRS